MESESSFSMSISGMKLLRCALCKSAPFSDCRVGQDLGELDLLLQIFCCRIFLQLDKRTIFVGTYHFVFVICFPLQKI